MFFKAERAVSRALGGGLHKPVVVRYPLRDLERDAQSKVTSPEKQMSMDMSKTTG